MNIGKIDRQVLKMMNTAHKVVRKVEIGPRERRYMQDVCKKSSIITGKPLSEIQKITENASLDQFTFLKSLITKFNIIRLHSADEQPEKILDIFSVVDKPSALHLNIVKKSNDSFEALEKIFSLAKDEKTLQYVEDLQYGELKNSKKSSKIIIDLLSSKNADRYVYNPERYSSYIELYADKEDAIEKLDKLIETGKFSRLHSDAKLAIRRLFKKQRIDIAMAGKTNDLEKLYTKDRASFLKSLVRNFMPARVTPKEETKAVVVNMYGSLDSKNAKLRNAIVERFKNAPVKDRAAEIVEMQTLFNKIDKDKDAKTFVKKAISKDLKIGSIAELNEVINTVPLKKANIFFNNTKRIVERTSGEERKTALITEMENPFYESKAPRNGKARIVRMFADKPQKEDFFTKTYKIIENKINQYRYSRLSA